jgi:hypothetical protein
MNYMPGSSSNNHSKPRPLRTYEGIWRELRNTRKVVLVLIDPGFYPRIKRMIIKEKCMDQGFKLLNEIEKYNLKFDWVEKDKKLTVQLVSRFGVSDMNG